MAAAFAANRDPIVQRPEQMPKPALMSRSAISPKNTRNCTAHIANHFSIELKKYFCQVLCRSRDLRLIGNVCHQSTVIIYQLNRPIPVNRIPSVNPDRLDNCGFVKYLLRPANDGRKKIVHFHLIFDKALIKKIIYCSIQS